MNYPDYNYIPTFDECKQIVNDCSAFSHSTQTIHGEEIHSFKYNLMGNDQWEGHGHLNLRGITFDSKGNLLALAFPKFFNRGEHHSVENVDMSDFRCFVQKVDGSLISFFRVNGKIECKSMKSVYSDVAIECREYAKTRSDIINFVDMLLTDGYSPIFEYVSPTARIVLDYGKKDLVFLGVRSFDTGNIYLAHQLEVPQSISTPSVFKTMDEASAYLKREDVEGLVVTMNSGLMLKLKTEHYCKIHKALDGFGAKIVVGRIIEGTYDDLIGVLTEFGMNDEVIRAKKIADRFWHEVALLKNEAVKYYEMNRDRQRKDIALELLKDKSNKMLASLVFKLMDGMDPNPIIFKKIVDESKEWQL
jgi:T4 RnlA family RNA ligase